MSRPEPAAATQAASVQVVPTEAATEAPADATLAIALLRPGQPLPQPWFAVVDQPALTCDLCGGNVDELWPLADHPVDLEVDLRDGELCVCRRCAEAIRPVRRQHPIAAPAA